MCVDAGKQGLLQWLLRRIKAKMPFDANKLYASELLSILLQQTPENKLVLGDIDGIDVLLQQLAVSLKEKHQNCTSIDLYLKTLILNFSIIRGTIPKQPRSRR